MKQIIPILEMREVCQKARQENKTIAFVPTMGALHEGHLSLFREARKKADLLIVSIFVNPTQFNGSEDYLKYPRQVESDLKKCRDEKVDFVFTPDKKEIFSKKEKEIPLPTVALPLEGQLRPGHFVGVVLIVHKLFQIIQPHIALFGLKDFQQVRVIEEMVKLQKLNVKIWTHPIVRSPEGLALSSRNQRLSHAGLKQALHIHKALQEAQTLFEKGESFPSKIKNRIIQELEHGGLKIDSVDIVDAQTLEKIKTIQLPTLVAIAAFVEGVRLIDNCVLK